MQIEVVLNLLLVFYEAMKISGTSWPVISEDVQERCLKRISGGMRFIEGLSPQLPAQTTSDAVADHPEQQLLAYVYGKFKESDLLGIKTEAEKMGSVAIARSGRRRPSGRIALFMVAAPAQGFHPFDGHPILFRIASLFRPECPSRAGSGCSPSAIFRACVDPCTGARVLAPKAVWPA